MVIGIIILVIAIGVGGYFLYKRGDQDGDGAQDIKISAKEVAEDVKDKVEDVVEDVKKKVARKPRRKKASKPTRSKAGTGGGTTDYYGGTR